MEMELVERRVNLRRLVSNFACFARLTKHWLIKLLKLKP